MSEATGPRLWILEDSESSQFVFQETLATLYPLNFFTSIEDFKIASQEQRPRPELLIADLRLKDGNFLDFLGADEADKIITCPFIVVSSLDEADILRTCFDEGALDYLTKPFTRNELLVKVERILKKRGELSLDPVSFKLKRGDQVLLQLTPKELQIFTLLQSNFGKPIARSRLQKEIWGGAPVSQKSLDVHLFHLRKKLGAAKMKIDFVQGQGFVLVEQ